MSSIVRNTITLIISMIMAVTCILAVGESAYAKARVQKPAKPKVIIKVNTPTWKKYNKNRKCGIFTVSWKQSKGAKKYRLFEKKDGKWKALKMIKAKKNGSYKGVNYTVKIKNNKYIWKLTKSPLGKKRYFRIRAINGKKKVYSNIVSRKIAVPKRPVVKSDAGTFVLGEKATVTLRGNVKRNIIVKDIRTLENNVKYVEGTIDGESDSWIVFMHIDKNGKLLLFDGGLFDECRGFVAINGTIEYWERNILILDPIPSISIIWSNDGIEPVEGQEERTITDPDTGKVYPLCGKVEHTEDYPGHFCFYEPDKYNKVHKQLLDKVVIWYKVVDEGTVCEEHYEVIK